MNDNMHVEAIAGRWIYRTPHDPFAEERRRFQGTGAYSTFAQVKRLAGKGIAAWKRRLAINQTITALSELDNDRLQDIGIHWSQIANVAEFVVDNPSIDPRPHFE